LLNTAIERLSDHVTPEHHIEIASRSIRASTGRFASAPAQLAPYASASEFTGCRFRFCISVVSYVLLNLSLGLFLQTAAKPPLFAEDAQFWFETHARRWKSRPRSGRPTVAVEIRRLIREMSISNPLWGAPRIHGELLKLGIEIGQTSVAKYMVRRRRPPSRGWRAFIRNHADGIAAAAQSSADCIINMSGFDLRQAGGNGENLPEQRATIFGGASTI
jgi:hypothetical protein